MAYSVIWSELAISQRKEILQYWIDRNKSNTYSIKLNNLINKSVAALSLFPFIGRESNKPSVRVKVIKDYLLIYKILDNEIHILTIWDSRQKDIPL